MGFFKGIKKEELKALIELNKQGNKVKQEKELIQHLITEVRKQFANGEISQNAFNREIDNLTKKLKEIK